MLVRRPWTVLVTSAVMLSGTLSMATGSTASQLAPNQSTVVTHVVGTTTGALPACAPDYWPGAIADYTGFADGIRHGTVFRDDNASALSKADCLFQNAHPPTNYNFFRAVDGSFEPSEVSASTTTQQMSLRILKVGYSSVTGFDNWGCAPQTSFPGGCASTWRSDVIYRKANAAGKFDGVWFPAWNNPYFVLDYTACGSADSVPGALPCPVSVRFAKDVDGKVVLQDNLQVVVSISTAGTRPSETGTEPFGREIPVSFMVRAGGGLAVSAAAAPRTVTYGKPATVRGRVDGVVTGSNVVVESGPVGGAGPWRTIQSAATDANGNVAFVVRPTATARYRVRLVGGAVGATVSADAGIISVASAVTIAVGKAARGRVPVTVTLRPGGGLVAVQRLAKGTWVTVKSATVTSKGTRKISTKIPRGRSTLRVAVPARSGLLGSVSATFRVRR